MDLKEAAILGSNADQHWYYRSKAAAVRRYIGAAASGLVLDVGAGSGFFTKYLLRHTIARAGLCVDPGYLTDSEVHYYGKQIQFRRSCGIVPADTVLLMDVLEHVDDDLAVLMEYVDKVPRGARFVITVPAFDWLWSSHDVFLEHRRRYSIGELEAVVSRAGLRIERSSYYFGLILPLVSVVRLSEALRTRARSRPRSHLRKHSWFANTVLTLACRAELPILRANRMCGLTVYCLAQKP